MVAGVVAIKLSLPPLNGRMLFIATCNVLLEVITPTVVGSKQACKLNMKHVVYQTFLATLMQRARPSLEMGPPNAIKLVQELRIQDTSDTLNMAHRPNVVLERGSKSWIGPERIFLHGEKMTSTLPTIQDAKLVQLGTIKNSAQ
jgi:hypothetical protein